jgi:hypothetical protein
MFAVIASVSDLIFKLAVCATLWKLVSFMRATVEWERIAANRLGALETRRLVHDVPTTLERRSPYRSAEPVSRGCIRCRCEDCEHLRETALYRELS